MPSDFFRQKAYAARESLRDLQLGGQRVFCGFPPWRPISVPLQGEARLMDMPVPKASKRGYGLGLDPIRLAPTEEVRPFRS